MSDCNGRIGHHIPNCDNTINMNGERLLNFRDDSGLCILNCTNFCKGKFTWFRNDQQGAIDYMLCSENILSNVNEFIVDDTRSMNLGSDHNVLLLRCNFKKSTNSSNNHNNNSLNWDIKPNHDWSDFQNELACKFLNWNVDDFDNVDDIWLSWKNKVIEAANTTIGTRKTNSKLRNWWDKDIDKCIKDRKEACKRHRQWCKGNRHDNQLGQDLWDDYQTKRSRVKSIIKEKIMQKRVERSIKIANEGGPQSRNFWQTLKGNKTKQDVYSIKDPASNQIINEPKKIKNCILYYWRTLGKMNRELNKDNNYVSTYNVKDMVSQYRSAGGSIINVNQDCLTRIDLTIDKVSDAISNSKNNKSPGIDGITNELIKNGGACLTNSLFKLFGKIIDTNKTPKEWNTGVIIPIHKKGDHSDLNNYRGITLTPCISKIFNRIIANDISDFLEKNNILTEVQGGFRKDHRCEDHIFTLKSIAASRLAEGKETYLAFLDFSKAFDTVWRDGLLYSAWDIGIRGNVWNLIDNLYSNVQAKVKFNNVTTDFFEIDEGVKQGCVLSPILFCIYIHQLTKIFNENNLGVNVCNVRIGSLFWADDIVLIANNDWELQQMLDLAANFAEKWKLSFNHTKSNVLIVGKRINKDRLWHLGDKQITEVDTYKYLGVYIDRNLSDHRHIEEVIKKGYRMIGYIKSIIDGQDDFNRVYYGDLLWKNLGLSTINYASSVWMPSNIKDCKKLETLQNFMARSILKASRNTPVECLLGELGWQPISIIQDNLRAKYFERLRTMSIHRWPKLMFNVTRMIDFYNPVKNKNKHLRWVSYVNNMFTEYGMDHVLSDTSMNSSSSINRFKDNIKDVNNCKWINGVRSKSSLLYYALLKDKPLLEEYLLCNTDFYGASLKFKARSNTLPLNARTYKWNNDNSTICPLCNNGNEDLKHFLFTCNSLQNIRAAEYKCLENDLKDNNFDDIWYLFISSDLNVKTCLYLGLSKTYFMDVNIDCALDIFDHACKSFLKKAWYVRNELLT